MDFSPFILQYCRAMENELAECFFIGFQKYFNENQLEISLQHELSYAKENKKYYLESFAKNLIKDDKKYMLGEMLMILRSIRKKGATYEASVLLQRFQDYVQEFFEFEKISDELLNTIENIVNAYRNRAAHPDILNLSVAEECKGALRGCLNDFNKCKELID